MPRFSTTEQLYNVTDFSDAENKWFLRGDISSFEWTESHLKLLQKNILDSRETFALRQIEFQTLEIEPKHASSIAFEKNRLKANANSKLLRVHAEIAVIDASKSGPLDRSRLPGYMVWFYDSEGDVKKYITIKSFKAESEALHYADRTVVVPRDVHSIGLVFMLRDSDAVFEIRSMSALFVEESKLFKLISYSLWTCYGLFICLCIWLVLGNRRLVVTIGLIVIIATLILGIIVPDAMRLEFIKSIYKYIYIISSWPTWDSFDSVLIFKVGHVLAFTIISLYLLVFRQKTKNSIVCLLCALFIFAISTETIQLYLYDREARIKDVFLDLLGVGIGYLVYVLMSYLPLNKKRIV